ncbi:MAG: sarcosine oxidase subunit gamma [Pseudomonadota bacterium]
MVRLIARAPCEGLLPVSGDGVDLTEPEFEHLISLGDLGGLSASLKAACGLDLPEAGRVTGAAGARCAWFGQSHYLLIGREPGALSGAAVTDQSDAWCRVRVTGPRAAEALAYLCPLDLRAAAFPDGSAARSLIGHMNALILHVDGGYELFVFRSMAGTLVHELKEALKSLP